MNAEHIHDALNYLPEDLIRQVDRLRTRQAAPRRGFRHLGAIAACLAVLILGSFVWGFLLPRGGSSTDCAESAEANMEMQTLNETAAATEAQSQSTVEEDFAADAGPEACCVTARFICESFDGLLVDHPPVTVLHSRQELEEFCGTDLPEALQQYDDAYFTENDLILANLGQDSSSVTYEITGILPIGDHAWELQGLKHVPEDVTDDMVQWFALVDAEKGLIQPGDTVGLSWASETD